VFHIQIFSKKPGGGVKVMTQTSWAIQADVFREKRMEANNGVYEGYRGTFVEVTH